MRSNYKQLGNYICEVNIRDSNLKVELLLGVSIQKKFIPSIANTIGTDMSTYKIVKKNQFAYGPVTSRNGDKISIALLEDEQAIISQAYRSFEVKDKNELLPEYLMMWFRRPEFDRYARFMSHGSTREVFDWVEMCETELPVPHIDKQKEIVKEYNVLVDRINLNNQLIQKLEESARAIYRQWFVDFEFPDENGKPYESTGGEMEFNEELEKDIPKGWNCGSIGDYSKVKSGFAFKSDWWKSEGIPVVKIGSINNNSIDYNSLGYVSSERIDKAKNYRVNKGDIVIAMTGATIGKVGLVPELNSVILVNQRVGMFDLGNEPLKRNSFLYLSLLSESVQNEIKNVGGDSAQANIGNGQIQDIQLIIPNISVLGNFNRVVSSIIETILNKVKENNIAENTKNLLLSKLATIKK